MLWLQIYPKTTVKIRTTSHGRLWDTLRRRFPTSSEYSNSQATGRVAQWQGVRFRLSSLKIPGSIPGVVDSFWFFVPSSSGVHFLIWWPLFFSVCGCFHVVNISFWSCGGLYDSYMLLRNLKVTISNRSRLALSTPRHETPSCLHYYCYYKHVDYYS